MQNVKKNAWQCSKSGNQLQIFLYPKIVNQYDK
jgi:hypothetical protein